MSIEKQYKILVVDDEIDNITMFVREFRRVFNFLQANSAEEALDVLAKEKDVAIVVTDQRMDGMTGVELLEKIKVLYPQIIRILVTGYTDINAAVSAINRGDVYRYIQKPVEKEPTFEILKEALGKYTEGLQIREAVEDVKKKIKERFIEIYESMASGIAHHVNNGLVPTKTFYDLLPAKMKAFKEGKYDDEFFEQFFNQAVHDLLSVQKIIGMFTWVRNCRVEQFQAQKIEELVVSADSELQAVIKDRKIELEKEIPTGLPSVIVDRLKTQEMISLLIKNCAKEAPEGSKVKVKAEQKNGAVKIKVSRTGPTYKPEEIPRLFDPFYKFDKALKDGVSGLDLTNCYIIAAKHGSEVKVVSNEETTFSIELPIAKPA